jgi:hypothetical protein
MTDAEFARAFEGGAIAPADFDHDAHLRVAWVYLRESASHDAAIARMRAGIQRFAAAAGQPEKYHETITRAWMILLAQVRASQAAEYELQDVLGRYPALADKNVLLKYYSRERLFGEAARRQWIEPDVAPISL